MATMKRADPVGTTTARKPVPGAPGYETDSIVSGHAYGRNGNAHNPTARYTYRLYCDGKLVDRSSRHATLVEAARTINYREN